MVSRNILLVWVLTALLAWTLGFFVLYTLTGFHLKYVKPYPLEFKGISFDSKGFSLRLRGFRIRSTLWAGVRYLELTLDGLQITLPSTGSLSNKKQDTNSENRQPETNQIDYRKGLSGFLVRKLVSILPNVNIVLRNVSISQDNTQILDSVQTTLYVNSKATKAGTLQYSVNIESKKATGALLTLEKSECDTAFCLDTENLSISSLSTSLDCIGLSLSAFNIISKFSSKNSSESEDSQPQSEKEQKKLFKFFYYLLDEATIRLEELSITDIPVMVPEMEEVNYFTGTRPHQYLQIQAKSISFNYSKLDASTPGFQLLYELDDVPVQLAANIMLLKSTYVSGSNSQEFFILPNLSYSTKSNIFSRLLQGEGFDKCSVESFISASLPLLEFSTDYFGNLIYNISMIKKALESRSQPPSTSSASAGRGSKIISLLSKVYPKVDLKWVVDRPTLVLKHTTDNHIGLLTFHYSLCNFQALTTTNRDYDIKLQAIDGGIKYCEKSLHSPLTKEYRDAFLNAFEVLNIQSLLMKIKILKEFKIETNLSIENIHLDLSDLKVLHGMQVLLTDVTTRTLESIDKHPQVEGDKEEIVEKEVRLEDKLFQYLPSWMVSASMVISNVNLVVGTRSVFIPLESMTALDKRFGDDFVSLGILRNVRLSLDKACFRIKNSHQENSSSETTSSHQPMDENTSSDCCTFWSAELDISSIISGIAAIEDPGAKLVYEDFVNIPSISGKIESRALNSKYQLYTTGSINDLALRYDTTIHFIILNMLYLVYGTLVKPLSKISLITDKLSTKNTVTKQVGPTLLDLLSVDISIGNTNFLLHLSEDYSLKIEIFKLGCTLSQDSTLSINSDIIRVLMDSPTAPSYWNRLICIDDLIVSTKLNQELKVEILSESIRLIQADKFVVHKLFDSLSITIKIFKHLVSVLQGKTLETLVPPSIDDPIKLPPVSLGSKKLSFTIEDDPFEAELNIIFQLGLVEQQRREEQMNLLLEVLENHQSSSEDDEMENISQEKIFLLHKTFAASWKSKLSDHKYRLGNEIFINRKYLYGQEAKLPERYNKDVLPYAKYAPLVSMILSDIKLHCSSPKFSFDELPDFIHEYGKGVPKDTKYALMVPIYLDLQVNEVRMHMRDYPLPLLYVPRGKVSDSKSSLALHGHLVIGEAFTDAKEALRTVVVPLLPDSNKEDVDKYHRLAIQKTLTPVKLFTNLTAEFSSQVPTKFTWGQSYQPTLQQIMLQVDQFSKPSIDRSENVGFWDKVRLILHGKFHLKFNNNGQLHVLFKGSHNPYELLGSSAGFVLGFKNNICVLVNDTGKSSDFITVEADEISWTVPNHLSEPLLVWSRNSTKSVYFPTSDTFISSLFGYNLSQPKSTNKEHPRIEEEYYEKVAIRLTGGIGFKVGFLFERDENGKRVSDFKPHYEVQLCNPDYAEDDHDSYEGFRSNYIHMAITFKSNKKESYNTVHLTPGVLRQFINWWKLFESNMSLPVRTGDLFEAKEQTKKLPQYLFTNKFQFLVEPLYISHIYRDEYVDFEDDSINCVGLRGKFTTFLADIHMRKEQVTLVNEELNKHKKVLKMNFNIGEISTSGIDIRIIDGDFEKMSLDGSSESQTVDSTEQVFDENKEWIDIEDFEEVSNPSLKPCKRTIKVYPILSSESFGYYRNTESKTDDKDKLSDLETPFGDELSHECLLNTKDIFEIQGDCWKSRGKELKKQLQLNKSKNITSGGLLKRYNNILEKVQDFENERIKTKDKDDESAGETRYRKDFEKFSNQLFWNIALFKWNNVNRDLLLRYIHFVKVRSAIWSYLSYDSIQAVEDIIREQQDHFETTDMDKIASKLSELETSKDRPTKDTQEVLPDGSPEAKKSLKNLHSNLRKVGSNEKIHEDFLIQLISPQIQLVSDKNPDSVMMVTAPLIECHILSVEEASSREISNPRELEKRYGVVLEDANIFVLEKADIRDSSYLIVSNNTYGSTTNWPPWLGIEVCYDGQLAGRENLLIKDTSIMVRYDMLTPLSTSEGEENEKRNNLVVAVPKIVVSCTSRQYIILYDMLAHLLIYTEPANEALQKRLDRFIFSIDFNDLSGIMLRSKSLQSSYRSLGILVNNYNFRQKYLSNESLNDYLSIISESGNLVSELYLLLQSVFTGGKDLRNSQDEFEWNIESDQIIVHMLQDDYEPFLDIAIARGMYQRLTDHYGVTHNRVRVGMIQVFNLMEDVLYPEILSPLHGEKAETGSSDSVLNVSWSMNRTVGGIRIVENLETNFQPLDVKVEEKAGNMLMKYLFPEDEASASLLDQIENSASDEDGEDEVGDEDLEEAEEAQDEEARNGENEETSEDENEDGGHPKDTNGGRINGQDSSELTKDSSRSPKKTISQKSLNNGNSEAKTSVSDASNPHSYKNMMRMASKSQPDVKDDEGDDPSDVEEMMDRSTKNLSIVNGLIRSVQLRVSFKSTGLKRVLNVREFMVTLPELQIAHKIWSMFDLAEFFKKNVIKALLAHTGHLIRNKMRLRRRPKRLTGRSLHPLKSYESFTKVSDLLITSIEGKGGIKGSIRRRALKERASEVSRKD